jgi:hypothetical protein
MSKVGNNGKEEINFVENQDFFNMVDGTYWTIKALSTKYETAENTIYKKAKEYGINRINIAGLTCFKDDNRFKKQPRNSDASNMRSLIAYPQLHDSVLTAISKIETMNANLDILIHNVNKLIKEFNINDGHLDTNKPNDPQKG